MHSFCVREVQKEGLLCAVNGQRWPLDILANSCRWLSLRSHILDYHVLFRSNIPRSLFFCQRDFEMFIAFKHLRVVDLSQSGILKGVPLPLRNLVFLRYLWVPQWFESLDDVVSTNSNLQTLIVPGIDEPTTLGAPTLHLTSKIWELQHLRHLELGDMYTLDPPNMVKEHLQTLVCAMPIHCFRKEEVCYCRFPSIRKLKIVYKDVLVPGCSNPITIVENFEDLSKLEALSVIVPVGSITLLERVGFPANLKELRLSGTNLPVKVLGVIGELPKLEILKLENIVLYGSRVWEVVKGGFGVLKELELEATNVERWVCKGSNQFPKLRRLFLKRCCSLEEIPPRIAQRIGVFFSIELEQCPPCVVSSAKSIQKERMRNLQHDVPRVIVDGKIISCTKSEVWGEEEEEDYDESQCTKSEAWKEEEEEDDDESVSTDSESSEEEEEDYYERAYIESKASEEGLEEASEEEDYDEWEATESSEEEE
ncbi:putative late blight resistance protein homolog R1B-23 [Ipomoea triloba]|uniref:putative late blight resistance protein homolog R1B-23 n=1 Tax=Ipomoea triloba TaxID=35885 RepID=UPI00125D31B9|nr:putative late blight resistance protein homolog R1B-23 [Ipomoea triloba]